MATRVKAPRTDASIPELESWLLEHGHYSAEGDPLNQATRKVDERYRELLEALNLRHAEGHADPSRAGRRGEPAPKLTPKQTRPDRRKEILNRWYARVARRLIAEEWSNSSGKTFARELDLLLHFSEWEEITVLMRELNDGGEPGLRAFAAALVRVIQLKEMPYAEYLQTDDWKFRAEAAKKRYDGKCALDDSHPAEHAHHRTYARRGREWPADLIPLCADCHTKFHGRD
jgi:hypothetical protein